jgi:uncharacterized peroxidase-related enzyme
MSWIKTIDYNEADTVLKRVYDRVKGPDNKVDNVLTIHSLRPHSLVGHMTLYKSVLHNSNNTLPKWYLEALGVYVSYLNGCNYCVEHHLEGLKRLLNDEDKFESFFKSVKNDSLHSFFNDKYLLGANYAKKLTLEIKNIDKSDIDQMKIEGLSEGEILEINQVVSYFNYVNRTVLGLGVSLDGDTIGLSPNESDDPKNWSHQ